MQPSKEAQAEYDRLMAMSLTALQGILRRMSYDGPRVTDKDQAVQEILSLLGLSESGPTKGQEVSTHVHRSARAGAHRAGLHDSFRARQVPRLGARAGALDLRPDPAAPDRLDLTARANSADRRSSEGWRSAVVEALTPKTMRKGRFYEVRTSRESTEPDRFLFVTGFNSNGTAKGISYDVARNKATKQSFNGYNLSLASEVKPSEVDGRAKAQIARKLEGQSFEDFTEAALKPGVPATVAAGPGEFHIIFRTGQSLASARRYWTGAKWSDARVDARSYGSRKEASADLRAAKKSLDEASGPEGRVKSVRITREMLQQVRPQTYTEEILQPYIALLRSGKYPPIVLLDDAVFDGNHRIAAAHRLGWKTIRARFLDSDAAHESLDEVSPPGFKGTVKAMKKHPDIDNPYALSWWMKKRGAKSHYRSDGTKKESIVEARVDPKALADMAKLIQRYAKLAKSATDPDLQRVYAADLSSYETIRDLLKKGAISAARSYATNLDTAARDPLPDSVWYGAFGFEESIEEAWRPMSKRVAGWSISVKTGPILSLRLRDPEGDEWETEEIYRDRTGFQVELTGVTDFDRTLSLKDLPKALAAWLEDHYDDWEAERSESIDERTSPLEQVRTYLIQNPGKGFTADEMASLLGGSSAGVRKLLNQLVIQGTAELSRGKFVLAGGAGKLHLARYNAPLPSRGVHSQRTLAPVRKGALRIFGEGEKPTDAELKKGRLVAKGTAGIDARYVDVGGTVWYVASGALVNKGPADKFVAQVKAGKLKAKLVEGVDEVQRTTFGELSVGDRYALPGMSMVYQKVSDTAYQLVKLTTKEPGGARSREKPTTPVIRMGPKAYHYDGPGAMHVKPENRIPEDDEFDFDLEQGEDLTWTETQLRRQWEESGSDLEFEEWLEAEGFEEDDEADESVDEGAYAFKSAAGGDYSGENRAQVAKNLRANVAKARTTKEREHAKAQVSYFLAARTISSKDGADILRLLDEAVDESKAKSYVARIKNEGKRKYAEAWLKYVTKGGEKPDREEFGISVMAAQAVRMELAELGVEERVDEAVDLVLLAGIGLSALAGAGLSAAVLKVLRTAKAAISAGKESAAERAIRQLGKRDAAAVSALIDREAAKLGLKKKRESVEEKKGAKRFKSGGSSRGRPWQWYVWPKGTTNNEVNPKRQLVVATSEQKALEIAKRSDPDVDEKSYNVWRPKAHWESHQMFAFELEPADTLVLTDGHHEVVGFDYSADGDVLLVLADEAGRRFSMAAERETVFDVIPEMHTEIIEARGKKRKGGSTIVRVVLKDRDKQRVLGKIIVSSEKAQMAGELPVGVMSSGMASATFEITDQRAAQKWAAKITKEYGDDVTVTIKSARSAWGESVEESEAAAVAAGYTEKRRAGKTGRSCGTCSHGEKLGSGYVRCHLFEFRALASAVCDRWASADESVEEAEHMILDEDISAEAALAQIKAGDRVTILIPAGRGRQGQEWKKKTGKAVMKGPHGWSLNMGGRFGTPGVATPKNIVGWKGKRVTPADGGPEGVWVETRSGTVGGFANGGPGGGPPLNRRKGIGGRADTPRPPADAGAKNAGGDVSEVMKRIGAYSVRTQGKNVWIDDEVAKRSYSVYYRKGGFHLQSEAPTDDSVPFEKSKLPAEVLRAAREAYRVANPATASAWVKEDVTIPAEHVDVFLQRCSGYLLDSTPVEQHGPSLVVTTDADTVERICRDLTHTVLA